MRKLLTIVAVLGTALLCVPFAHATSYVYDAGADLDYDAGPLPDGGANPIAPKTNAYMVPFPANQKIDAIEATKWRQAIIDERDARIHGYFDGLADQGITPVPAPADGVREFAMDGGLYGEYPDGGVFSIGPGGWLTAQDCDYTAQNPQSVSANGPMTVCGLLGTAIVSNGATSYATAVAILPDAGGLSILTNCATAGSTPFGSPLVPDAGS